MHLHDSWRKLSIYLEYICHATFVKIKLKLLSKYEGKKISSYLTHVYFFQWSKYIFVVDISKVDH